MTSGAMSIAAPDFCGPRMNEHVAFMSNPELKYISTNAEMTLDAAPSFQYSLKYEKDGCRRGPGRARPG